MNFTCPKCAYRADVEFWPVTCACGTRFHQGVDGQATCNQLFCAGLGGFSQSIDKGMLSCGCQTVTLFRCNVHNEQVTLSELPEEPREVLQRVEPTYNGRTCHKCRDRFGSGITMLRKPAKRIGFKFHRSGWPYATSFLDGTSRKGGIYLEDFVEQRFCYAPKPVAITEPWVGIFHHPPNMPIYSQERERMEVFMQCHEFQISKRHLRLAITLSEYHAQALRERLSCPVVSIKHPTGEGKPWRRADRLLQLGVYLRNVRAINLVQTDMPRLKLMPQKQWVRDWDRTCTQQFGEGQEVETHIGRVDDDMYDELLATSVVLTHMIDASANNVVVECIRRSTPIVINRHPAVMEYLGEDYPLYFDDLSQVGELLAPDSVAAANRYLVGLPKPWIEGEAFAESVLEAIGGIR